MKKGQAGGSMLFMMLLALLLAALLFFSGAYTKEAIKRTLLDAGVYLLPAAWSIIILVIAIIARSVLFLFISYSMKDYPSDLRKSLKALLSITIFGITLLAVIGIFTRGEMIFTILIGGFVVAILIATRTLIEDFARRFMLLSSNAINLGDYVEVEGVKGRVLEFGTIYTTIRRDDNTLISIPNKEMVSLRVVNYSKTPHLKVQDSIELRVDKKAAEKISFWIQKELEAKGFERCHVTPFKSGDKVKFVASITPEETANMKQVSDALTNILKKALSKYG